MQKKKFYIIAGEASGDLHGANLIKAFHQENYPVEWRGWGGDLMQQEIGSLVRHIDDLAFMGAAAVLKKLKTILDNFRLCKKDILAYQPDALILIDYSAFNLPIARWAKKKGLKVYYYISPKIWAWNTRRVHKVNRSVDKLFCILPFEQDFYKKYGYSVDYVGNPLLDQIKQFEVHENFKASNQLDDRPIIAVLPGSRYQEVTAILNTMLEVTSNYPDYQFVIAGAKSIRRDYLEELIQQANLSTDNVKLVYNQTYDVLAHAYAGLITSGTATLETALFNIPQVVCYQTSPLTYWIGRMVVSVNYISLVNLIMDKPVVKELLQSTFNPETLKEELDAILSGERRQLMLDDYDRLQERIGAVGASTRVAKGIIEDLN